jgi:ankyrin repeat protein
LHCAAFNGHLAIAKRLLEGGADPTLRNKDGKTAVDCAREQGQSEVVALLSEPRYADERANDERDCHAAAAPSWAHAVGGWLADGKRRRLATGCGREDATADLPRVRVPCAIARPSQAMIAAEWARAQSAVMGTSGVGGTGGLLWVATPVAAAIGRAGRATDSAPTHAQARAQVHTGALRRTHRQHSSSNQAALTSNHEQSLALGRPTPSPNAVVLGEGAAAATASVTALPSTRTHPSQALALPDCMR